MTFTGKQLRNKRTTMKLKTIKKEETPTPNRRYASIGSYVQIVSGYCNIL